MAEAGLPPGWLNIVTGRPEEIVPIWNEHPDVAVITFTGSAEVGWKLKAASPRKRHVLELGSNTAMVVAADADLRRAVDAVVTGGYTFSGQACVSVQRVYVEEPVAEEFTALLAAAVDQVPIGDTRDPATVVGPVISEQARERLLDWIDEAVQGGARIATGGTLEGACLRPTVLADVPASARVVCEEVFGPVASIRTVKSVAEGIEEVNSARYGLNTAIFTSDLASALQFAREAEAGSVLVNITPSFRADHMPYGGVKDSGQGREGVKYAIAELLDQRLVVLALTTLRIGILGAARIAAEGIVEPARLLGHRLVAVAARDRTRAEAFAAEHGVERAHDGYADVVNDPDVDLVYNALVNSRHAEWNAAALRAGKHC